MVLQQLAILSLPKGRSVEEYGVKRLQRNMLILGGITLFFVAGSPYLTSATKLALGSFILFVALTIIIASKEFLIARSKTKKKD
jgi:hypothetical protein